MDIYKKRDMIRRMECVAEIKGISLRLPGSRE